jgi:acyl dehydratase
MMFFEDVVVGEVSDLGAHTFTAEEIKRFASAFDPQPFHTDEAAAAASHFGGLCASGWHTLAVWMRLNVRQLQQRAGEQAAAGVKSARLGPSPGFEQLKWLRPVYAGDNVSFTTEVIAKRASRSRPGWGVVSMRSMGRNQAGEDVISFVGHVFVESRGENAPAGEA